MPCRYLLGAVLIAVVVALSPGPVAAQDDLPRTSWGTPDLQGVWDYATMTPLNRPTDLADREYLTKEEALAMEQRRRDRQAEINARPSRRTEADPSGNVDRGIEGGPGSFNRHWFDSRKFVSPTLRTSLVVDPSNGRMPPMNLVARAKWDAENQLRKDLGLQEHEPTPGGWVEDMGHNSLQARCITGFNAGPPMLAGGYNNNVQLFQTEDVVVIYNEMVHDARIVPLDGRAHVGVKQLSGNSRGYWEGDTLVVHTTGFRRETTFMGGRTTPELRVTERFSLYSPDVLLYRATVDDPGRWTRPWTYELAMRRNANLVYEFACHEGNYSLPTILRAAAIRDNRAADEASR